LTERLFDSVPLDRMKDAEQTLRKAAEEISEEIRNRFNKDKELSDEDRDKILQTAHKALQPFQQTSESRSEQEYKQETDAKFKPETQHETEIKTKS